MEAIDRILQQLFPVAIQLPLLMPSYLPLSNMLLLALLNPPDINHIHGPKVQVLRKKVQHSVHFLQQTYPMFPIYLVSAVVHILLHQVIILNRTLLELLKRYQLYLKPTQISQIPVLVLHVEKNLNLVCSSILHHLTVHKLPAVIK